MKQSRGIAASCGVALLTLGIAACAGSDKAPIAAVQQVDLSRYAGRWYVIGVIPTRFERDGYNSVETYTLDKDGHMCTWFHLRQGGFDGPVKTLRSVGYPDSASGNAVWSVHLYGLLRLQYKIAWLADDYSRVIVARDKRDYVWIMARMPKIADADYAAMVDRVNGMGYDISKLRRVPQQWPEPPTAPKLSESNPCD